MVAVSTSVEIFEWSIPFENIYPLNLKTGFNKKNCIFKGDGIH